MHAGIGLGGDTEANPLSENLASLASVAAFPDHEVLPGHGYRFRGLLERSKQSAQHHLRRSTEVAAVLAESHKASIWEIASRLTWTAGWENLQGLPPHYDRGGHRWTARANRKGLRGARAHLASRGPESMPRHARYCDLARRRGRTMRRWASCGGRAMPATPARLPQSPRPSCSKTLCRSALESFSSRSVVRPDQVSSRRPH
jgi:hypothetical protein